MLFPTKKGNLVSNERKGERKKKKKRGIGKMELRKVEPNKIL